MFDQNNYPKWLFLFMLLCTNFLWANETANSGMSVRNTEIGSIKLFEKRLSELKAIDNQQKLIDIAFNDDDDRIKCAAFCNINDQYHRLHLIDKINNPCLLCKIICNDESWSVKAKAVEKITDIRILKEIALFVNNPIAEVALKKEFPQKDLAEIVLYSKFDQLYKKALCYISDSKILYNLYMKNIDQYNVSKMSCVYFLPENQKYNLLDEDSYKSYSRRMHIQENSLKYISDETILLELLNSLKDEKQLIILLNKISNQDVLAEVALNHYSEKIRATAAQSIEDFNVLNEIAISQDLPSVREKAIEQLTDEELLNEISQYDSDKEIRTKAYLRLKSIRILKEGAQKRGDSDLRKKIIRDYLKDQTMLLKIAMTDCQNSVREEAIIKLTNQDDLIKVLHANDNEYVKKTILNCLKDTSLFTQIYLNDKNINIKLYLIGLIEDQNFIDNIINKTEIKKIKIKAIDKTTNSQLLKKILFSEDDYDLSHSAYWGLGTKLTKKDVKSIKNKIVKKEAKEQLKRWNKW